MSTPLKVAVLGAGGRMGRTLVGLVAAAPERFRLVGATTGPDDPALGEDAGAMAGTAALDVALGADASAAVTGADVAIDFTLPAAFDTNLAAIGAAGTALVIGVTGLTADQLERLGAHARSAPVVYTRNFSPGVTMLTELARLAARALDTDYDAEIIEAHHRRKIDAPSGTALALGEAVAAGRGGELESLADWARHGECGAREPGRIGFAVVRGGGIVGEHTVMFAGDEERLELTHRAADRTVFARGALRAAAWVGSRAPGLYDMRDVLGLPRAG